MAQLEFITSVMQGFPASRSAREKDGALNMTRALDMTMLKHPKVGDMLEGFFVAYVIPELGSSDRFLRFRSTDLIRTFSAQMRWRDQKVSAASKHATSASSDTLHRTSRAPSAAS